MAIQKNLFKYNILIEDLPGCPPENYRGISSAAYRWVFKDTNHPHNFKPGRLIKPDRPLRTDIQRCLASGLSFFDNLEGARDRLSGLLRKNPNLTKVFGDHIATLYITPDDGVGSVPERNNYGHFTFHEYICTDFVTKVANVTPIQPV